MKSFFIFLLIAIFIQKHETFKILMYQIAFSNSHMPFSGAIADALIDRGHVVDKLIMLYNSGVTSNGTNRLRNVYRIQIENVENVFMKVDHLTNPFETKRLHRSDPVYLKTRYNFCKKLLEDDALIHKLKAEKYDVYMTTPYDFCFMALNQMLLIPVVNIYSVTAQDGMHGQSQKLGKPMLPSVIPQMFDCRVQGKNKGFIERLNTFLYLAESEYNEFGIGRDEMEYMRYKIPNLPSLTEMFKTISYIFLNTNELLDISMPILSRTKFIGGLAMKRDEAKISEELETILSIPNSGGVVVFSFGSLIKTTSIPMSLKFEFLNAFKSFPNYNFIWKLDENDEILPYFTNFTNVFSAIWLPQVPLLNDNRVKLFITHSGMNSYLEASYAGKPILAIPFFVDQYYNTDCLLHNEVGVYLDKNKISSQTIIDALNEVLIDNSKYSENAKALASILKDRPANAKNELIRYVEYSAKHPRLVEFLQLESVDMPVWKLYSVDIMLFLVGCALVFMFSLVFVIRLFANLVRRKILSKPKRE